jgi:hypothetical protein
MSATLKLLVTQLQQSYDGEYAPNVENAWDDEEIAQNPAGWREKVQNVIESVAHGEYENSAVLTVEVDEKLLYGAPAQPSPDDPDWLVSKAGQYGLRLIVGERRDGSETWTQIVDVWDSYALDENSAGFRAKLSLERAKLGVGDYTWLKVIDLYLPDAVVDQAIAPWKQVHQAELVPSVSPEPEIESGSGMEL